MQIKEIKLVPSVSTLTRENAISSMANPLDKTFQEFVLADNVVGCQFGNYHALDESGEYVSVDTRNQAPYLFVGTIEDAVKNPYHKIFTKNGKHYVDIENGRYVLEIVQGAKFAPEKVANSENAKGEAVSNTRNVVMESESVNMGTNTADAGSRLVTGSSDPIGKRGNLPTTVNIDNENIEEIRFWERFVGYTDLPTKHLDPHNPDLEGTQKARISQTVDLSPTINIGETVTHDEIFEQYPDAIAERVTSSDWYKSRNGNFCSYNKGEPVVSAEQAQDLYKRAVGIKYRYQDLTKWEKDIARKGVESYKATQDPQFADTVKEFDEAYGQGLMDNYFFTPENAQQGMTRKTLFLQEQARNQGGNEM